ncbi:MAG: hypothetical protein OXH84_01105 [Gammaproteobacteria bacterium]|nr:hypothetical protein [Gammaproteobacteria bacterium]
MKTTNKEIHKVVGECHCGNIAFELTTQKELADIVGRSCDCTFCQNHNPIYWADPEGSIAIRVKDVSSLQKYRFGHKTADFYICRVCGSYLGAVLEDDNDIWSVVNLRLTELDVQHIQPVSYGNEDYSNRETRRKRLWAPTTIEAT